MRLKMDREFSYKFVESITSELVNVQPIGDAFNSLVKILNSNPNCSITILKKQHFACHRCDYSGLVAPNLANCHKCGASVF